MKDIKDKSNEDTFNWRKPISTEERVKKTKAFYFVVDKYIKEKTK